MITIALGTTPTILVKLNEVSPKSFVIADLTIKKGDTIILTRHIDTAAIADNEISWKLTQKETLGFSVSTAYRVMCNWVTSDGTRGIVKEASLQVIDNHENWELNPGDSGTDEDDEIIIQNDPFDADGYITPQQFGAKGNGVTDDTDAIQAALDADGSVYFSRGEYVISRPIVIVWADSLILGARRDGDGIADPMLSGKLLQFRIYERRLTDSETAALLGVSSLSDVITADKDA